MILITRPKDQAINLYEKLSAQGFRCHVESLSQIKLINQNLKFDKNKIHLVSSPRVVDVLIKNIHKIQNISLLVIGSNSAKRIVKAGFKKLVFQASNSEEMFHFIKTSKIKSIEYLTGTVRNREFCDKINKLDIKLNLRIVYETRFRKSFTPKCINLIKKKSVKIALVYSVANARHLISLIDKSKAELYAKHIIYVCLSKKISEVFQIRGFSSVYSNHPNEKNMLKKLKKVI